VRCDDSAAPTARAPAARFLTRRHGDERDLRADRRVRARRIVRRDDHDDISPIVEIVIGSILLLLALVFFSGRDQRYNARRERKHEAKDKKGPSKAMQVLQRGTPRTTFVVGAVVIGIPGVSYLTGMDLLSRRHVSTLAAVLVVLAWNVIMLLLLEVPIVAYAFAPQGTAQKVESFKTWLTRDESRIAYWCALVPGAALLAIGVVRLLRSRERRPSSRTPRDAATNAGELRRRSDHPLRSHRVRPGRKALVMRNQPFRPMTDRRFSTYGQPLCPASLPTRSRKIPARRFSALGQVPPAARAYRKLGATKPPRGARRRACLADRPWFCSRIRRYERATDDLRNLSR